MNGKFTSHQIVEMSVLEKIYGLPAATSMKKEVDYIHPHYQKLIEVSPFVILATNGSNGLDASPRGDAPGFVHVCDEKTLHLPDRRGNNRIDSLRNIIEDPRVGMLFLIPGVGETLRINGRAIIDVDPVLLARFAVDGKPPRSVLTIKVEAVFFQCSRAILRSQLWQNGAQIDRSTLPSTGSILQDLSNAEIDGIGYDQELPTRLKSTMY